MSLPAPEPSRPPTSILSLLAILVAHRQLLAWSIVVSAALAATWSLLVRPSYSASTSFVAGDQPASALPSGLAALGAGLGASFSMGEGSRSLQFYTSVLLGHDMLATVARDTFAVSRGDGRPQPLTQLLDQGGATQERRIENTVKYLHDNAITAAADDRTGIITITASLHSPELAAAVANRLYRQLERFNYAMRRAGAAERRAFSERELASARQALEDKERDLRTFLESNRAGLDMPRLALERSRLQRRIDVAQASVSQMTQELTEARIAEARDTPIFTVVQQAGPPLVRC
jgi:uncharacterized protein involved in exopolysaccharide biosynthesis